MFDFREKKKGLVEPMEGEKKRGREEKLTTHEKKGEKTRVVLSTWSLILGKEYSF